MGAIVGAVKSGQSVRVKKSGLVSSGCLQRGAGLHEHAILLVHLVDEGLVDMWDDTTASDGRLRRQSNTGKARNQVSSGRPHLQS